MNDPKDEKSDLDQRNPGDTDTETWSEIYSKMDDFEGYQDRDQSMDF